MNIYSTLEDYIPEAKKNDLIVFDGMGIMSGIRSLSSKHDVYKVCSVSKTDITFKAFRGKSELRTHHRQQQIALLSKDEFNKLPKLW